MHLSRVQLAMLIPHAGAMCLLDVVRYWNDTQIVCVSGTHRNLENPLRRHGRLHAVASVEYASQAMAAHGALVNPSVPRSKRGFLITVRNFRMYRQVLDDLEGDLEITAHRLTGAIQGAMYAFDVRSGIQKIASGKAVAILDAHFP